MDVYGSSEIDYSMLQWEVMTVCKQMAIFQNKDISRSNHLVQYLATVCTLSYMQPVQCPPEMGIQPSEFLHTPSCAQQGNQLEYISFSALYKDFGRSKQSALMPCSWCNHTALQRKDNSSPSQLLGSMDLSACRVPIQRKQVSLCNKSRVTVKITQISMYTFRLTHAQMT